MHSPNAKFFIHTGLLAVGFCLLFQANLQVSLIFKKVMFYN